MKHLGDITKISGYNVPVVDIVVGGSPCQDLSIAGKREGLAGQRSGLFMEQIRIVKEMRENDKRNTGAVEHIRYIRPRYMVWENVPGAFSSNKGEDFRAVLEETARIVQEDAVIPRFEGGWRPAGVILGDGWSIAWRVHDAQFWGVPQRRKRISLVADFGGATAPEVLFECKGLSGDIEESGKKGEGVATDFRAGIEETGRAVVIGFDAYNQSSTGNITMPLKNKSADSDRNPVVCIENHPADSRVKISDDGKVQTLSGRMGTGGGNVPMVMEAMRIGNGQADQTKVSGKVGALNCMHDQQAVMITYGIDRAAYNQEENALYDFSVEEEKIATQVAKGPGAVCNNYVVRRLTPMECERLQGFPDGWTDIGDWIDSKGKKHKGESDAPRYKALGNSIALPFWEWMAKKMCSYLENPTMASLFDGIGGFPLVYSRVGCKPVWASEIEEFPIAVTKKMFGEE